MAVIEYIQKVLNHLIRRTFAEKVSATVKEGHNFVQDRPAVEVAHNDSVDRNTLNNLALSHDLTT